MATTFTLFPEFLWARLSGLFRLRGLAWRRPSPVSWIRRGAPWRTTGGAGGNTLEGDMEALHIIRACALDPSGRDVQWGDLCVWRNVGHCTVTFPAHGIAVQASGAPWVAEHCCHQCVP